CLYRPGRMVRISRTDRGGLSLASGRSVLFRFGVDWIGAGTQQVFGRIIGTALTRFLGGLLLPGGGSGTLASALCRTTQSFKRVIALATKDTADPQVRLREGYFDAGVVERLGNGPGIGRVHGG